MTRPIHVRLPSRFDPYVPGFRDHLSAQGYSGLRLLFHLRLMTFLGRWLEDHGVASREFAPSHAEAYLADRRSSHPYLARLSMRGLAPVVTYLRTIRVFPEPPSSAPTTPLDELVERFVTYLRQERGLAEQTVDRYRSTAKRFLEDRARRATGREAPGLRELGPRDVASFVMDEAARLDVGSLRQTASALRTFLRFLHACDQTSICLAAAVPTAAGWRGAALPRALEPAEVTKLLAACDRRTGPGLRDYAIVTLLWRLGLRAGEVAACKVGDIDWRSGTMLVRGKGNRWDTLPLPVDVGEALVDYCCRGRPQGSRHEELFLQKTAPHGPLTTHSVSQSVRQACMRAGLPPVGAHRLRHTAATEMLRAGNPLAAIGQVLRHREVATTALYAKVDRDNLRTIARPWPGAPA